MKQLNSYDDRDEAEIALTKVSGPKRLASERDGTDVIYNLFGTPTWGNFYKLGMFNLKELEKIIDLKQAGQPYDLEKHINIITMLGYVAKSFNLTIPVHWS